MSRKHILTKFNTVFFTICHHIIILVTTTCRIALYSLSDIVCPDFMLTFTDLPL